MIGMVRRRLCVQFAALAGVLGVSLAAVASSEAALPPGCVQAGATVLCPFLSTGAEQQFVVPSGVFSLGVTAVGGKGGAGADDSGAGTTGGAGGFGAVVTGQLAVTPGRVLYLEVGGNGQAGTGAGAAGGFNGGGTGSYGGLVASGGGGGASDLRTCPRASLSCTLGASSDPRLLVAAGGGGGGAAASGNGGAGGAAGPLPATGAPGTTSGGGGGAGGRGGSLSTGGAGGAAGTPFSVPASPGTDGSVGQGGNGSAATGFTQATGGGGGGGWTGGGGGGSGAFNASSLGGGGGGGAGASFASPGATVTQDPTGTPAIIISYLAPTQAAAAAPTSLNFGTQPQSTISAPKTVMITNSGKAQLVVTGLTFTGSAPQDYLLASNGCLGPIAPGASCTVGVSFAPQAQASSTASLQIASSDPGGPATVSLSGTGGPLPQGPPGQPGPQGPAGQVELVVCHAVTKTVVSHGRKRKVTVQKCSTKLVSGPVKFVTNAGTASATVARDGITYATGRAVPMGSGRWEIVLTRQTRRFTPGRYILTLTTHHGRKRVAHRRTITIT